MLMNDKIMFDRHYCINSMKKQQRLSKCSRTLFFSLNTHLHCLLARTCFVYRMLDSGRGQVLMISRVDLEAYHVLCMAARNRMKIKSQSHILTARKLLC